MAADVDNSLALWSTTEGSNKPTGTTSISTNLDDNLRRIQAIVRYLQSNDTIASASTTDLGTKEASLIGISGTTTITSLGTISIGIRKWVYFTGALILTHDGTALILPTGANITTAAGDCAVFASLGSGNWRCMSYMRASGLPLNGSLAAGDGSVGSPSVYFASDTNNGLYRIGTDNWGLSAGGVKVVDLAATVVTIPVAAVVGGALTAGPSTAFKIDADGSLTFNAPAASGQSLISSGANDLEVYGHSTGGGRLSMLAGGAFLYAGNNKPLQLICQGTGGVGLADNATGEALRFVASTGHLSVVETIGIPTITSGAGSGATISGTDQAFKLTLGSGPGTSVVITFARAWTNVPMVFPRYQGAAIDVRATATTTTVTLTFASTPTGSQVLDVLCIGYLTS